MQQKILVHLIFGHLRMVKKPVPRICVCHNPIGTVFIVKMNCDHMSPTKA